jgi:hypothetical protein
VTALFFLLIYVGCGIGSPSYRVLVWALRVFQPNGFPFFEPRLPGRTGGGNHVFLPAVSYMLSARCIGTFPVTSWRPSQTALLAQLEAN